MTKISKPFSELLGFLCAEGHHKISYSSYWGKERGKPRFYRNHKSECIEFFSKDKNLLKHYQKIIYEIFGYNPNITKDNKIHICRRKPISIITKYTEIGHLKWKVPDLILKSKQEIKIAFLKGYFEGDGTASNRIRMFSTNKSGLNQVSLILDDLKIKHTWQGPILKENRKPSYILQISQKSRERFLNLLKPISKRPDICEGNQ